MPYPHPPEARELGRVEINPLLNTVFDRPNRIRLEIQNFQGIFPTTLPVVRGLYRVRYRRKWATERKHLPDVDVATAGGWKELESLRQCY